MSTAPATKAPNAEPPKQAAKIGDTRPHPTNPYQVETMTGWNGDGSQVWRTLPRTGIR